MEAKLVIFLAFTSFTLIFNAVVIWYAYKAFANTTFKLTQTLREAQARESTKVWLNAMASASHHAVSLTDTAKTQLANFDPVLSRAQTEYEFRLAQVDVQMEKGLNKIRSKTESFQTSLVRPAHRLGATLAGVFEVIHYFSGEHRIDEAEDSTPKQ